MNESIPSFPFSALVGLEDLRIALLLAAIDPKIGGVLLRGEKGSAKTTAARGIATLLPGGARFVELPIGATEDRVVGAIDLRAALTEGERRFSAGLLADAHGGVLYVDEVNLLPDHLVDVLLDVATSGVNRVEREGISHSHPSRFVLIGSMNPEEGELRPQLLDRFGLSVHVTAPTDPATRAVAVARRLEFESDPTGFSARWQDEEAELSRRLALSTPARIPPEVLEAVSAICATAGAEGLRADLVCCRAAAAFAGFEGSAAVDLDHVRKVAPLALAHRTRHGPFDAPAFDPDEMEELLDRVLGEDGRSESQIPDVVADDNEMGESRQSEDPDRHGSGPDTESTPQKPDAGSRPPRFEARTFRSDSELNAPGRRTRIVSDSGRVVGSRQVSGSPRSIALFPTIDAAASRLAADPMRPSSVAVAIEPDDLREAVYESRAANVVVLLVDASGSMGAERRIAAAKGAAISLLVDAYERRDRVALVTFREEAAQVVLRPTGSVEVARARLVELKTGGRTPLAAGIESALELAVNAQKGDHKPLLVLVSDGRATSEPSGADPFEKALEVAHRVRRMKVPALVVDAEGSGSGIKLGLARVLAEAMGARLVPADELTADALAETVKKALVD